MPLTSNGLNRETCHPLSWCQAGAPTLGGPEHRAHQTPFPGSSVGQGCWQLWAQGLCGQRSGTGVGAEGPPKHRCHQQGSWGEKAFKGGACKLPSFHHGNGSREQLQVPWGQSLWGPVPCPLSGLPWWTQVTPQTCWMWWGGMFEGLDCAVSHCNSPLHLARD